MTPASIRRRLERLEKSTATTRFPRKYAAFWDFITLGEDAPAGDWLDCWNQFDDDIKESIQAALAYDPKDCPIDKRLRQAAMAEPAESPTASASSSDSEY